MPFFLMTLKQVFRQRILWFGVVVIAGLLLVPFFTHRSVSTQTTPQVLAVASVGEASGQSAADLKAVADQISPRLLKAYRTRQAAVARAVRRGDRLGFTQAMARLLALPLLPGFANSTYRAQFAYLARHHVPYYASYDNHFPWTNYLLKRVMYAQDTTLIILTLSVVIAWLVTVGQSRHQDELDAVMPLAAGVKWAVSVICVMIASITMLVAALVLASLPVIATAGFGSLFVDVYQESDQGAPVIHTLLDAGGFYALALLGYTAIITGTCLIVSKVSRGFFPSLLVTACVLLLPAAKLLNTAALDGSWLQYLPAASLNLSRTLLNNQNGTLVGLSLGQTLTALAVTAAGLLLVSYLLSHAQFRRRGESA
ncbi:hypothetical protein [Lacticaseibacillus kribbianus]|uniref:hypothetical protein n=1 Tax=Lacticaseibacillus kribbianus TaxID=2926292 RepID=UPI001CD42872|nr:hypothetical protein [Lacticaseibacillus kribbianus]